MDDRGPWSARPGYPTVLYGLVHKCLAERPQAILLDLHAATPVDAMLPPVVLSVVNRAVAREGARLILTGGAAVLSTLNLSGRRELSLYPDRREAERAAALAMPPELLWWTLRAGAKVEEYTNAAVNEACLAWNIPDAREKLGLIASELVVNAVQHAGVPVEVNLSLQQGYAHLRVRGADPTSPTVHGGRRGLGGSAARLGAADPPTPTYVREWVPGVLGEEHRDALPVCDALDGFPEQAGDGDDLHHRGQVGRLRLDAVGDQEALDRAVV